MSEVAERMIRNRAVVTRVVRAATGRRNAELAAGAVRSEPVAVGAMATEALVRVCGTLVDGDDPAPWSVVLKVVHSPDRSPVWAHIPPEFRAVTLKGIRWRTEPDVYRSALHHLLPAGLRMPVVYDIEEVDDATTAIWMEDVAHRDGPWTLDDYRRAGRLLGRLAGRFPEAAPAAPLPVHPADLRGYFDGRIRHGVLPALRDEAIWAHPMCAPAVDGDLRRDLHVLGGAAPAILDRVDALPRTLAHGDACPQNLLWAVAGDLVAIDWQFASWRAVGYDVGQLVAGHAESGDLDPAQLHATFAAALDGYTAGLLEEGSSIAADDVALGAAGALVVRSAFTALPLELLEVAPTPDVSRLFERRARFARFLVDLAAASFPIGRPT